jgi:hypothetical protein
LLLAESGAGFTSEAAVTGPEVEDVRACAEVEELEASEPEALPEIGADSTA